MIPLTKKQQELLAYLKACEDCPSFDEMREALGLKSKSGVHRLISALEERGYIRRAKRLARAIELIDDAKLPETIAPFSAYTTHQLAEEAGRRGFLVGKIYRDTDGNRKFHAVA